MITLRSAMDRGHFEHDWLKSYHTFSFSEYYDPKHMHFSFLRVINEDYVKAASGFPTHSHQDMEIMTYMISGELEHKDSMGNTSVIKSGEVQFMRAGSGVTHSEFNPSKTETTHLLQIWIIPNAKGLNPTYAQNLYTKEQKKDKLCVLASGDGQGGAFKIAQNVTIYASILESSSAPLELELKPENMLWIQVVAGELKVNGITASAGDGAAIQAETKLSLLSASHAEFILFKFN